MECGSIWKACDGEGKAMRCGLSLICEGEVLFPEAGFRISDGEALCGNDQAICGGGGDGD